MPEQDLLIARQRTLVLTGSVSMLFITGGAMFMIVVALKQMATEFGWPREVPSLAFSLQFVGSGFGGLIMGRVVDRWGFGVPALLATGMVSVGAMLVSEITAAWQLYMIYLIMFGLSGQGALAAPALCQYRAFGIQNIGVRPLVLSPVDKLWQE